MKQFSKVLIAVILFDQVTKYIARYFGVAMLNSGISFGLFSNNSSLVFVAITFSILFFFYYLSSVIYSLSHHSLAFGLLFGGGLANCIDRLVYGGVWDFLPIPFTRLQNNIADYAIALSIFLLIWRYNKKVDSR